MTETSDNKKPPAGIDFAPLIREFRQELEKTGAAPRQNFFINPDEKQRVLKRLGFRPGREGRGLIVPAEETAVELGPPSSESLDIVMTTENAELIRDGAITVIGPDLAALRGRPAAFCQAVLLAFRPGQAAKLFELMNRRFLFNRLPGYMVRSVPGRLWVRVSHELMDAGFGFFELGLAIHSAYREDPAVAACELMFCAADSETVKKFSRLAAQAEALSHKSRKLELESDGTYSCDDLDCESCDEKTYCDELRDLIKYRRDLKKQRESEA